MFSFNEKPNKFAIGKEILLKGYPHRVFEVISFLHKTTFVNGKLEDEHIYTLKDTNNGEILTGYTQDMRLCQNKKKMEEEKLKFEEICNVALDTYNDYRALHDMFGDQEYLDKAKETLELLKLFTDERNEVK